MSEVVVSASAAAAIDREALWREASQLLINGTPSASVIETLRDSGLPEHELTQEVDRLSRQPLLSLARLTNERLKARDWLLARYAELEHYHVLAEIDGDCDVDSFVQVYVRHNRPLLCRRVAEHWLAVKKWNHDYLVDRCGSAMVDVMLNRSTHLPSEQSAGGACRHRMEFRRFLSLVYSGSATNDYYLVAKNDFFSSPQTRVLADDLGSLNIAKVDTESGTVKLWCGPAGTLTSFHYDSRSTVLVQLVGTKQVELVAPWYGPRMQQVGPWYAGVDPLTHATDTSSDTLRATTITLRAGDCVFIPVGWWHSVLATTVSISLTCTDIAS